MGIKKTLDDFDSANYHCQYIFLGPYVTYKNTNKLPINITLTFIGEFKYITFYEKIVQPYQLSQHVLDRSLLRENFKFSLSWSCALSPSLVVFETFCLKFWLLPRTFKTKAFQLTEVHKHQIYVPKA